MAFLIDRDHGGATRDGRSFGAGQASPPAAGLRPAFSVLSALPDNPVPAGGRSGVLRTRDGVALRYAVWEPARRARGTVLLLQGRADFIEKYFETAHELLARGYAVATFDWRGQGGSQRLLPDPHKGHVDDFAHYQRDLEAALGLVAWLRLPRPFLGLAHSMGAAILLHALARQPDLLPAAVLSAPMIRIAPTLKPPAAEAMTRVAAWAGLRAAPIPGPVSRGKVASEFDPGNLLTSDPVRYARSYAMVTAAPDIALGKPTIGWMQAAFAAMAAFRKPRFAAAIGTPLLTVAGDADQVTATPAAIDLAARLPRGEVGVLPGCGHEILLEQDHHRARFWAAFDAFADRPR
ncbi:MAG: alpha/beta hydrolase [Alsobacter sp.]